MGKITNQLKQTPRSKLLLGLIIGALPLAYIIYISTALLQKSPLYGVNPSQSDDIRYIELSNRDDSYITFDTAFTIVSPKWELLQDEQNMLLSNITSSIETASFPISLEATDEICVDYVYYHFEILKLSAEFTVAALFGERIGNMDDPICYQVRDPTRNIHSISNLQFEETPLNAVFPSPKTYWYPYDDTTLHLYFLVEYSVHRSDDVIYTEIVEPSRVLIKFRELLSRDWDLSIDVKENDEVMSVDSINRTTSIDTDYGFYSLMGNLPFSEEIPENVGLTQPNLVEIKFSRPLLPKMIYPIVIFSIALLSAILFTSSSYSILIEGFIGLIFGMIGLKQILIPSQITGRTVWDGAILLLYVLLFFGFTLSMLSRFWKNISPLPSENNIKSNNQTQDQPTETDNKFLASINSDVFHKRECQLADRIMLGNLITFNDYADSIASGRRPCDTCLPTDTETKQQQPADQGAE